MEDGEAPNLKPFLKQVLHDLPDNLVLFPAGHYTQGGLLIVEQFELELLCYLVDGYVG